MQNPGSNTNGHHGHSSTRQSPWTGLLSLTVLILMLGAIAPRAVALELLGFEHQSLSDGSISNLKHLKGKPTLLMFYEPDCPWCFKQGRAFNKLLSHCGEELQIVALGTHGDKASLKRELWKMKPDFPGFIAGQEMINSVGNLPATPMTLVADSNGEFISYMRGYIKLETLEPLLKKQLGLICKG
ncbi:redoxin domain-containing protein [Shewanella corallii]|uniref:Redoxin domain-containing protein n=1 Tax=Shewanella corallii TaxID=560080 RepID=A0ABT0N6U5_9GAMM|nr:redoxin domain-containing protein [Shewanella corallii]MCL2913552.1 redoxin domain-containing protein [Shewanella corallii]